MGSIFLIEIRARYSRQTYELTAVKQVVQDRLPDFAVVEHVQMYRRDYVYFVSFVGEYRMKDYLVFAGSFHISLPP